MKAKILEIAQVKNEQEFYRKYPTEEAFMKKHGKAFKKAQTGSVLSSINAKLNLQNTDLWNKTNPVNQYLTPATEEPLKLESWMSDDNYWKPGGGNSNLNIGKVLDTGIPMIGGIIKGFQLLADEKRQLKKAKQWEKVTDVQRKASQLQPEMTERKYVRPEDQVYTGSELFPIYGNEADVLAKHGKTIKAEGGSAIPWESIGNIGSQTLTSIMGEDGGGTLGSTIGGGIGNLIAPGIGGAIGKVGGQLIGSLIDTRPERIKRYKEAINRNVGEIAMGEGMKGIFSSNSQYMKDGGYIKNGNMVLKNGNASPISNNIMQFYGPSHEKGGIDLFYGGSPVEVEGGETAVELNDGGTVDKEMVVFGNVKAPGYGKSFKNVVKDIAEKENKATRTLLSSANVLKSLDVEDPFDKLKFDSNRINVEGATQQLKKYKEETSHLAALQEAINATADEMRVNPEELASGKIKVAKNGAVIKAKAGVKIAKKEDYVTMLMDSANKHGVDFNFLNSLVEQESGYRLVISKSGAKGIMQFMPGTAKKYGVDKILSSNDSKDVKRVIDAGVKHFKELLAANNNDYDLAAAAYNGGQGAVDFVKKSLGKDNISGEDLITFYEQRRENYPSRDTNAWQNQTLDYVKTIRENSSQSAINSPLNERNENDAYNPKTGEYIPIRGSERSPRKKWDVVGKSLDWTTDEISNIYNENVPEKAKKVIDKTVNVLGNAYDKTFGVFDIDQDIQYGLPPIPSRIKGNLVGKGTSKAKNRALSIKEINAEKAAAASREAAIKDADELSGVTRNVKSTNNVKRDISDEDIIKGILEDDVATATKSKTVAKVSPEKKADVVNKDRGALKPLLLTTGAIGGLGGLISLLSNGEEENKEGIVGFSSTKPSGVSNSNSSIDRASITDKDISEYLTPAIEEPLKLDPWITDEKNWQRSSKMSMSRRRDDIEKTRDDEKKEFDWNEVLNVANQILPYIRPSDTESLDPRQILGELSALGEKEEPMQAQLYHPQLTSPYKVSFQDQLNEITAQTRSAQRMVGGNAAAQAMIASQAYSAKNKVLADEFRTNQEMENRAYAENRNLLNQSILQNLAILDKQYERQSTAKSNTKAILRSALDSISDKYLKNQLENRTLATYENLYNYRFDPRFRAVNYNDPYSFNIERNVQGQPEVLPGDREYWYNSNRESVDIRKKSKSGTTYSRNGAIVKAVNEM